MGNIQNKVYINGVYYNSFNTFHWDKYFNPFLESKNIMFNNYTNSNYNLKNGSSRKNIQY
uniref:Uncharacterized protein n=1 Tax=viral metagenome TaxID=1070528 RepID=A0A6C0AEX4_9ZZZZ